MTSVSIGSPSGALTTAPERGNKTVGAFSPVDVKHSAVKHGVDHHKIRSHARDFSRADDPSSPRTWRSRDEQASSWTSSGSLCSLIRQHELVQITKASGAVARIGGGRTTTATSDAEI